MKTTAIMNFKGGVGKTVTAINMAAELASRGKSVIVIDADGQRNTSKFFGADTEGGNTLYEVLTRKAEPFYGDMLQETQIKGVKILPASMELIHADLAAIKDGGINLGAVRNLVTCIAEDDEADNVLIDCPPSFSAATTAALAAADEVVIPIKLDAFSLDGMGELMYQIGELRAVNPRLRIAGVLITMRNRTTVNAEAEKVLRESKVPVFRQTIRRATTVDQMTFRRRALRDIQPADGRQENVASDYRAFVDEYLKNGGAAHE